MCTARTEGASLGSNHCNTRTVCTLPDPAERGLSEMLRAISLHQNIARICDERRYEVCVGGELGRDYRLDWTVLSCCCTEQTTDQTHRPATNTTHLRGQY